MTDGPFFGSSGRPARRKPCRDVFPTEAEITARAYELFVAEGLNGERPSDYWRRAEDELLDLAARKVTR